MKGVKGIIIAIIWTLNGNEALGMVPARRDAPKPFSIGHSYFVSGSNSLLPKRMPIKPKSPLDAYPRLNPHLSEPPLPPYHAPNPPRTEVLSAPPPHIQTLRRKTSLLTSSYGRIPVPVPVRISPANIILPFAIDDLKHRRDTAKVKFFT